MLPAIKVPSSSRFPAHIVSLVAKASQANTRVVPSESKTSMTAKQQITERHNMAIKPKIGEEVAPDQLHVSPR